MGRVELKLKPWASGGINVCTREQGLSLGQGGTAAPGCCGEGSGIVGGHGKSKLTLVRVVTVPNLWPSGFTTSRTFS